MSSPGVANQPPCRSAMILRVNCPLWYTGNIQRGVTRWCQLPFGEILKYRRLKQAFISAERIDLEPVWIFSTIWQQDPLNLDVAPTILSLNETLHFSKVFCRSKPRRHADSKMLPYHTLKSSTASQLLCSHEAAAKVGADGTTPEKPAAVVKSAPVQKKTWPST